LQANGYSEEQGRSMYAKMREAAGRVFGVESIALSSDLPLSGNSGHDEQVHVEGSTEKSKAASISSVAVDRYYFSTLGIPVLAGRIFTSSDTAKAPAVIVINHLMAEKYWPGQNPIGKTVRIEDGNQTVTVVGVVGDGEYIDIDEPARPFMYFNLDQRYVAVVYLMARVHGDPHQWLAPLSEALQKTDAQLLFQTSLTMDDWINFSLYVPRITLVCISVFGGLAFVLAAAGLYGAVFYSVSERKKELGIRVALGAAPRDLWRMILLQTSAVTAAGICVGIVGGIIVSTLVRSQLYGIHPVEWSVFLAVALTMGGMTALTAYSAARPWMRADPMESVRHA
jgi:hypothetical protein